MRCSARKEKNMKTNTLFEQKLTEILARTLSGEVTPVEYALSNEPSETKGKVNQFVTFKYEVDEPSEKDGPQLKKIKPIKIKCGTPLERQKMHYIPKYSRDRQNKRRSQKFVTVLDKIDNLDGISLSKITNFVEESQENRLKLLGFGLQK